ncbi:DUF3868 domain-containing protein [Coprobacter tertius]|uniref:DUF3868 domain-containing protein n=1 Tax=Coprobacter tertius TaxID=2944915 RepID=A0ABT1MKN2_9BACT|nr:DUF3868 domain-containing protein [Coprobacter tertius]MCP9612263.1 DUF3868 domain-containing protein [Coprobacter tertius]
MKITTLYIISLLFGIFSTQSNAQTYSNYGIKITETKAECTGNSLYITLDIDLSGIDIKSRDGLILTPIVHSKGQELELPLVFLSGKNKYKAIQRSETFGNQIPKPFFMIRIGKDTPRNIHYSYTLPYQPWMENSGIFLKEELSGCADCKKAEFIIQLLSQIRLPLEPPLVAYITPPVETVKSRKFEGKAYLDFPTGKSVVLPSFSKNPEELQKIRNMINEIKDNRYAAITSIDLTGFASPEGPSILNERLSKDRSFALQKYLQTNYNLNSGIFNVSWKGEDWEGLKKEIIASNSRYKEALLDIIDSSVTGSTKNAQIKNLFKGSDYRMLLDKYYTRLRRVEYTLNYTIKAFSVTEGIEILKTAPSQMSLNEMFLVANTYPTGSKEFNDVFDIAVHNYPLDPIANINAGAVEILKNNLSQAHRYLDKYTENPQAWNNLGVLYMMEGNYEKAERFFRKAYPVNKKEAAHNLKQLRYHKLMKK